MTIPVKETAKISRLKKKLKALPTAEKGHFVIGYFLAKDFLVMGDRKIDRLLTIVKDASKVPDLVFQLDEGKNSLTVTAKSIGLHLKVTDASNSLAIRPDSLSPALGASRSFLERVSIREGREVCEILAWQLIA